MSFLRLLSHLTATALFILVLLSFPAVSEKCARVSTISLYSAVFFAAVVSPHKGGLRPTAMQSPYSFAAYSMPSSTITSSPFFARLLMPSIASSSLIPDSFITSFTDAAPFKNTIANASASLYVIFLPPSLRQLSKSQTLTCGSCNVHNSQTCCLFA